MFSKLYLSLIILNIVLIFFLAYNFFKTSEKIVIVDSKKLFNEFVMTKEIKESGNKTIKIMDSKIDSLSNMLKLSDGVRKQELIKIIFEQREMIENFDAEYTMQESPKIWKRINSYAKDYSNKNQIRFIIGSQYDGDILSSNDSDDITNDLLMYINKRYEGIY